MDALDRAMRQFCGTGARQRLHVNALNSSALHSAVRSFRGSSDFDWMTRMRAIKASALTSFDVSPDGRRLRIHIEDESGEPASLELPTHCLTELKMTLPK